MRHVLAPFLFHSQVEGQIAMEMATTYTSQHDAITLAIAESGQDHESQR